MYTLLCRTAPKEVFAGVDMLVVLPYDPCARNRVFFSETELRATYPIEVTKTCLDERKLSIKVSMSRMVNVKL